MNELNRCERTLSGNELKLARMTAFRASMAELGVSSTNLVFDTELATSVLSPEIVSILKDDPEQDDSIMRSRIPVTAQTSTIAESDQVRLDIEDIPSSGISGTEVVADRLKYWVHDLKRWSSGFDVIKFKRSQHKRAKELLALTVPAENLTTRGKVMTRKKPVPRRVPRKVQHNTGLMK